jgi:basic amino acid/polyamine antiporter, APA family
MQGLFFTCERENRISPVSSNKQAGSLRYVGQSNPIVRPWRFVLTRGHFSDGYLPKRFASMNKQHELKKELGLAHVFTIAAGAMIGSGLFILMLPASLSKLNARFHTPHIAIGATGALILLGLLLPLKILVEAASCVLILTYMLSCLAVIVLRESRLSNYRPLFHAPLYPWLQIGGLLALGFVFVGLGVEAYIISAILILVAFLIFWVYGRKQASQESALLHLISRLTDRRLVSGSLEAELKQIIKDRDEIVWDRFDHLVQDAVVLDVDEPMKLDEFFDLAANKHASRLDLTPQQLAKVLRQREEENSTLLSSTLAVPHVVVPGEGHFAMLIARMKGGVQFTDDAPDVHTIFVLTATRDERNFHLRALAAIAQVVQQKDFEQRWLAAKDAQGLRDVILLSERKRALAPQSDSVSEE